MSVRLADKDTTILRFAVGDRVECNCGKWMLGTVAKLFYVQSTFKEGMCAPYQVKLDDGKLIFAPMATTAWSRGAPEALAAEEEDDFTTRRSPTRRSSPSPSSLASSAAARRPSSTTSSRRSTACASA